MTSLFALLLCYFTLHFVHAQPIVTLPSGATVSGAVTSLGVNAYHRIHYASQPPRFGRSTIATTVSGQNIQASKAAYPQPVCPQVVSSNIYSVTEDCLLLSIYTPPNVNSTSNLAVMLFIHGGSFLTGTGMIYDGSSFVLENNVVFVTINYRLAFLGFGGMIGFLGDSSVGNYGLSDQLVALQWVKNNIQSFGGNPNMVTIVGESAGATAVCFHLASPLSRGLFKSAILESSNCETVWSLQQTVSLSTQILSTTSCASFLSNSTALLSCISGLPLSSLVSVPGLSLSLAAGTVDGVYITDTYSNMIKVGKGSNVPVIAYVNMNETAVFYCSDAYTSIESSQLGGVWSYFLNGNSTASSEVINFYQNTYQSTLTPFQLLVQSTTDAFFRCSTRSALDSLVTANLNGAFGASSSRPPLYLFSFEYTPGYSTSCKGAYHGAEIVLLFPSLATIVAPYVLSAAEVQLGVNMRAVWSTFAKTGTAVNSIVRITDYCGASASVNSSNSCSHAYLRIASPTNVQMVPSGYYDSTCAFWHQTDTRLLTQLNGSNVLAFQTSIPGSSPLPSSSPSSTGSAYRIVTSHFGLTLLVLCLCLMA